MIKNFFFSILTLTLVSLTINHKSDQQYTCDLISDTSYYKSGKIKSISYGTSDEKCLALNRRKISVILYSEGCWDCSENSVNDTALFKKATVKEGDTFSYLWWENGIKKRDYKVFEKNNHLYLSKLKYDSLGSLIEEKIYFYKQDSIISLHENLKFTGWFHSK